MELTQEQELEQIPDRPSKLFWIHNKCLIDEEDSEIVSDNDNDDWQSSEMSSIRISRNEECLH